MRALSGVKATGSITLGNYIGAVSIWAQSQQKYDENFYFVPDLHSLNVRPDPKKLTSDSYDAVAILLAAGIDPGKSVIYLQSQIPAHSELLNILNNYVTMGELSRMVQFKEKQQKHSAEGLVVGFFEYPVLMAADILLYDADIIPVGDDQTQHVELARKIAERFNNAHGKTFKLPRAVIPETGARIMDLQDPTKKMSKSDEDSSGCIFINDTEAEIRRKLARAVTDSDNTVKADKKNKSGVTNLLEIYSALSGKGISELEKHYGGKGYGAFKKDLIEVVINVLNPLHQKYTKLMEDKGQIIAVLAEGKAKAEPIAQAKLAEVKQKIGLLTL